MPRRPRARSRAGRRHRTASTADDRRQVEELMERWRHNVPAREWERLARRMGRTAGRGPDQLPLELGQRRKMPNTRRPPVILVSICALPRRRRAAPPTPPGRQVLHGVDQAGEVPAEAVELPDDEHIALAQDTLAVCRDPADRLGHWTPGRGRCRPRRRRLSPGRRAASSATASRRSSRRRRRSRPHRARKRRGPHSIRSVRRGPRAGLPVRRFGASPRPPLLHAVPGREDAGRLDAVTRVYLDLNATTPDARRLSTRQRAPCATSLGNPSSVHAYGQEAKTRPQTRPGLRWRA